MLELIICLMLMQTNQDTQAGASMIVQNAELTDDGLIQGDWIDEFRLRCSTETDIGRITIWCPGYYTVDVDLNITDLFSPSWMHIELKLNGYTDDSWTHYGRSNGTPETITMHGMMWLNAGDTLCLRIDCFDVTGVNPVTGELIVVYDKGCRVLTGHIRALRYMMPTEGETEDPQKSLIIGPYGEPIWVDMERFQLDYQGGLGWEAEE